VGLSIAENSSIAGGDAIGSRINPTIFDDYEQLVMKVDANQLLRSIVELRKVAAEKTAGEIAQFSDQKE
jgi:hypothetical protein